MSAHGEVIEALELVTLKAEDVVDRVVKVRPDACGSDASGFRFEIQHLTHHPGFPIEMAVAPRPVFTQSGIEIRDHSQAERAGPRDFLSKAELSCGPPAIGGHQQIERQVFRALVRSGPGELTTCRRF